MALRRTILLSNGREIKVYGSSVVINGKVLYVAYDPEQLRGFIENLKKILVEIEEIGYVRGRKAELNALRNNFIEID